MPHALGIDVGTTNVKVAVVDPDGAVVAGAGRALTTIRDGSSAEQDAEHLWAMTVEATREAGAAAPAALAAVGAVGVCSQYSSIVPVAADGQPLAPFILHLDRRGTDRSWAILDAHDHAFAVWVERHGIPPVGHGLSLGHVLWFQHERPDLHAATSAYLEPMDFVGLRLTGRVAATQCTQFTTQLCDNRVLGVTEYDPELVALSGVDASRLPPLVEPQAPLGPVRPDMADLLGIRPDAVVAAGMNDSHAGALATGAFGPDRAGLMIGTTAVLLDDVAHHGVDLDHEIVSMPSPLPDRYLAWAENGIAGRAVAHVLEQVLRVPGGFTTLEEVVAATDPGANGALFLPWLTGSLAPKASPVARGGFLNLSLDTTQPHLVRALLEGTALNVAWLVPAVEGFTGHGVGEIVFGGGAARSPAWAQILADVLNRPVCPLRAPSTAAAQAVGAAALRTTGQGGPPMDVAPDVGPVREPDPTTRATYDVLVEQFQAAFEALRPISETLNERLAT